MNVIKEMLSNIETTPLQIGRVGENLHTQVRINCITIFQDYPEALVDMSVVPPVGDAYPAIVERDGVVVVWDVLSSDLAYEGRGQIQLTFRDDEEIIKTVIGSTTILPSIEPTGEAPTPIENWIDEANEILDEFGEVTNMTASAETVAAGASAEATVSKVDGHFNINFKIPRGASGNETIDDTAGIGDTDKVWSADKDAKEISALKSAKAPIITESISTPADVQTFTDGADGMLVKTLTVGIDPVQDLHGYDNPWPAGGGKNLLPMTLQNLKNMNTEDPWSGNVYTRRGITYTVNTDGGGNVVSITVNGTATYNSSLVIADSMNAILTVGSEYTLTGCPANGSRSTYAVTVGTGPDSSRLWVDEGSGDTMTYTGTYAQTDRKCFVAVFQGTTVTNLSFAPMMRLSSESATFAPYSNICPITGHTGANVSRTGKNLCVKTIKGFPYQTNGTIKIDNDTESVVFYAKKGTTYTVSHGSVANDRNTIVLVGTSDIVNGTPYTQLITLPLNSISTWEAVWDGWTVWYRKASVNADLEASAQVEVGSTASSYAEYHGSTAEYEFPQEAGTVYGGTLTIHQDGSGELVVDHKFATLNGSEGVNWAFIGTEKQIVYKNGVLNGVKTTGSYEQTALFNIFKTALNSSQLSVGSAGVDNGYLNMAFPLNTFSNANEVNTWLASNNVQVYYELAEPVVYTLTASQVGQILSLYGTNNLWADTGKINAVDYPADTKLYIDKKLTELQALVLEN